MRRRSEKRRRIELVRLGASNRQQGGAGKAETFNFSGFTPTGGTGRLVVRWKTMAKRLRAKLREVKEQPHRRRPESTEARGAGLGAAVAGYFNIHAVPMNYGRLATFRT